MTHAVLPLKPQLDHGTGWQLAEDMTRTGGGDDPTLSVYAAAAAAVLMSGSSSLSALGLNATKLPKPLGRACTPLSVIDRPDGRPMPLAAGDSEGLLGIRLLRGDPLIAGTQSREVPVGDAEDALSMLVRTATSFSASTLQDVLANQCNGQ